MQVQENEEDQDVSLAKEARFVLYFLHTRHRNLKTSIRFQFFQP